MVLSIWFPVFVLFALVDVLHFTSDVLYIWVVVVYSSLWLMFYISLVMFYISGLWLCTLRSNWCFPSSCFSLGFDLRLPLCILPFFFVFDFRLPLCILKHFLSVHDFRLLFPLTLLVRIPLRARCTTLSDKVCQ